MIFDRSAKELGSIGWFSSRSSSLAYRTYASGFYRVLQALIISQTFEPLVISRKKFSTNTPFNWAFATVFTHSQLSFLTSEANICRFPKSGGHPEIIQFKHIETIMVTWGSPMTNLKDMCMYIVFFLRALFQGAPVQSWACESWAMPAAQESRFGGT